MARKKKATKKTTRKKPTKRKPVKQKRAANSKKSASKKKTGKKRVIGRPFQKGQSGNPLGRPKIPREVIDAARAHSLDAIETLAKMLRSRNPMARIKAANSLLDRAWGKPTQMLEFGGSGNDIPNKIEIVLVSSKQSHA